MHVIGQILCYKVCFPNKSMHIHLFGGNVNDVSKSFLRVCKEHNIAITFEQKKINIIN